VRFSALLAEALAGVVQGGAAGAAPGSGRSAPR